ncbi:HesA/MoeB/ThiF family protein [Dyadobacter aurulentus]|uniref:HesA/MoeB/ThiF family protein n=1 Tax=Dyadobacter sp. UC 10 TaxID=2605428 RepID=UPI0011F29AB3|nr:HesA/MoeB/ThiF family protein [Dyadobacter sp. UC 10]KAA0991863.1 thiamine biosynthesis protein ThiF [Dyadobacter sp. UC 10]
MSKLESGERKQYSRQILLPEFGFSAQEKLKDAKVLVIGAGGLGCPVLQYITAAGIGSIGIIDHDMVEVTNLHRQILYAQADVGKSKAITAAGKLTALNGFVKFTTYPVKLTGENAPEIISDYDLVVDGSDNFETRYLVNDVCVAFGKPWIFGSILRFEGQVSVFNYENGPTYRCLFPDAEEGDNCAEAGVIGILPGIIGTYMANEVIKIASGVGGILSGELLVINALTNSNSIFKFNRTAPRSPLYSKKPQIKEESAEIRELSFEEFEKATGADPGHFHLVDVREDYEYEADNFGGVNIPLSEIPEMIPSFSSTQKVVFYCQSGKRSRQAAKLLAKSGFSGEAYWAHSW